MVLRPSEFDFYNRRIHAVVKVWPIDLCRSYFTPEEVIQYLQSVSACVVVVERRGDVTAFRHHDLVLQALDRYPERWGRIGSFGPVEAVQLRDCNSSPRSKVLLHLEHTLKRNIEK